MTSPRPTSPSPPGYPMLAGPGAISGILLQNEAKTISEHVALYSCILLVSVVSYLIFRLAVRGARWLNPIIMSIAVYHGFIAGGHRDQFMLNRIKEVQPVDHSTGPLKKK